MMVGTVVRMVVVMSVTEAHRFSGSFLPQVDLYLTGDLRVNRSRQSRRTASCGGHVLRSPLFLPAQDAPFQASHAAAGVSFASPAK